MVLESRFVLSLQKTTPPSSLITNRRRLSWNPTLGDDCSGLYIGWWICIGIPPTSTEVFAWYSTDAPADVPTFAGNYTPTTFPAVDAAFTASPTQAGIAAGCLSYYQAQDGDTCRSIVDGYYLTEAAFFAMNPALAGNCDGLWLGYWYCVVGAAGITVMPSTVSATPTPVPVGQTATCQHWFQRDGETCADIVAMFGAFSLTDFVGWNPSVGGQACAGLVDGAWYCVGVPGTPTTRTAPLATTSTPSTPTQSGMAAGCSKLWLVGR